MDLHKKIVKEGRIIKESVQNFSKAVPKDWTGETAISATTERECTMGGSGNRWCEDSSNHNGGCPVYLLLEQHPSSEKIIDSQETNKISVKTSKSTGNLDNALGEKSCISAQSVNNLFEIRTSETPSESEKGFVWSVIDRFRDNQNADSDKPTDIRLMEPAHASTGREWESGEASRTLGSRQLFGNQRGASATPVEARSAIKNAHNYNERLTNEVVVRELSDDDAIQYEHTLLNLLKSRHPFRDETDKNILYDDEISDFAEFYNITDFYPVLAYDDVIFWLKDFNGAIFMWSRAEETMIFGGHNLKEALLNFLFCQENLYYIEEYTHKLLSVKKVKEDAARCSEEGLKTETVMQYKPSKPLKDEKKESKKVGKGKKRQKNKNK